MLDWLCETGVPRWQVAVAAACAGLGVWVLCWWRWRRVGPIIATEGSHLDGVWRRALSREDVRAIEAGGKNPPAPSIGNMPDAPPAPPMPGLEVSRIQAEIDAAIGGVKDCPAWKRAARGKAPGHLHWAARAQDCDHDG